MVNKSNMVSALEELTLYWKTLRSKEASKYCVDHSGCHSPKNL